MLIILTAVVLLLAAGAIRAQRLLHAAIWLAGASAVLAILFYALGAPYVAVIELSVGAGLVTVLFVFAIGIAGDEALGLPPIVPRFLIWILAGGAALLLGALALPWTREGWLLVPAQPVSEVQMAAAVVEQPLQVVIWEERGLDVLVQVVLIFCGVLGLLGLLAEIRAPLQQPAAAEAAAQRDRELAALERQAEQPEKEGAR